MNPYMTFAIGIMVGIIVSLGTAVLTSLFPITESSLREVSEPAVTNLSPTSMEGKIVCYVNLVQRFKNFGLKRGYISKVEIERLGLEFEPEVEFVSIDKSPIYFLETKTIICQVIVRMQLFALKSYAGPAFRVTYYDDRGIAVHRRDEYLQTRDIFISERVPPLGYKPIEK